MTSFLIGRSADLLIGGGSQNCRLCGGSFRIGGAGPIHLNAVARLMGSWPAVSPVSSGVLCALGDATTRMRTEAARSFSTLASKTTADALLAVPVEMEQQIREELRAEGAARSDIDVVVDVNVRYSGQAFEVPMEVTISQLGEKGILSPTPRSERSQPSLVGRLRRSVGRSGGWQSASVSRDRLGSGSVGSRATPHRAVREAPA